MHISSHGDGRKLTIDYNDTEDCNKTKGVDIELVDIKNYCQEHELKAPLKGRFVTISACVYIHPQFALGFHDGGLKTSLVL